MADPGGEGDEESHRDHAQPAADHDSVRPVLVEVHHLADRRPVLGHAEPPQGVRDGEETGGREAGPARVASSGHGSIVPSGGKPVDYLGVIETATRCG
jgi:hypothetical protein